MESTMESTLVFLILCLSGLLVWTHWVEPNWFRLRREIVRLRKSLRQPLTILHLSDFHFTKQRFFVERFFNRLACLETDFVFLTGDLIDSPEGIDVCIANLRKLRARKGIYAVLGNHDYRTYPFRDQVVRLLTARICGTERPETDRLKRSLREIGVRLLVNEHVLIPLEEGKEITLIGIDDPITGRADLNRAFQGITNGILHVALTHSPILFPALERRGVDVAFAGHTHGGQIRLPGIGPLPYAYRLEPIIDSTRRYGFTGFVTRGMGANPLTRLRFFCRPEAVLVRIEGF